MQHNFFVEIKKFWKILKNYLTPKNIKKLKKKMILQKIL